MLAKTVETREEFSACQKAGFSYFQGYFFRKPELLHAREIPKNRVNYLRLLQAISHDEIELKEIDAIIKGEASLCYRLLRYLNSAAFGFSSEIHSVKHGLSILGERRSAAGCAWSRPWAPGRTNLPIWCFPPWFELAIANCLVRKFRTETPISFSSACFP